MKQVKIIAPVITAFNPDETLDDQGNQAVWDHLIRNGIDGIAVMGSTGEFFAMDMAQKKHLTRLALTHINGRTKAYIGTSCMKFDEMIDLSNYALDLGADAVMLIHPYYFALSDASVEAFFDEAAAKINGNIILYNFPARTGKDLSPDITIRLLRKHPNIVGYKDTVTEFGHTRKLITLAREEFANVNIFSGFDEFFAHNAMAGGGGCIGGLSNIYPGIYKEWIRAITDADTAAMERIQQKIGYLMGLYEIAPTFIPIIKKALILKGLPIQDVSTKPFLPASEQETEQIKTILNTFENMD